MIEATHKIKRSFTSLVSDLQKSLENKCKLEDVIKVLIFYDKNRFESVSACKSLKEVIDRARAFNSFFDYDIIKMLSRTFGSRIDQKRITDYKLKFRNYCKKRICELPVSDEGEEKAYAIIIDRSLDYLTSEELQRLQYSMNKVLGHAFIPLLQVDAAGCTVSVISDIRTMSKAKHVMSRLTYNQHSIIHHILHCICRYEL